MTNRIRVGILGAGRIVQRRMLPGAMNHPEAEILAIASQRADAAKEVGEQFQIPKTYQSYEDLLADSEIDAVYIPATGDQHCRWTVAAAEAGKHVLCEKPLAPTVDEAEEMTAACGKAGVILHEAFMWRHHPRAGKVRELIQEGVIGNLRLINVNFSFDIDRSDWRLRPERGGGAMWDLGCYGVNCARFMTSAEPIEIDAAAHWYETGVDMTMRIGLTFPDQVLANIDCSFEFPFRSRAEFVGDGGRIVLEKPFQPFLDHNIHLWRGTDRDTAAELIETSDVDQWACQLSDFCRSIRAGELLAPAENGLQNMKIMEQVLETAKSRAN